MQKATSCCPSFCIDARAELGGISFAQLLQQGDVMGLILEQLSPNEVACNVRLSCKDAAKHLLLPHHTRISLSQAVPCHAFRAHWGRPGAMRGVSLASRRRLWCLTARSGVVPNLECLLDHAGCSPTCDTFDAAAAAGQLPACEWLLHLGCPWGPEVVDAAARAGQMEACRWLVSRGCPRALTAVVSAAESGSRELYQWFRDRAEGFKHDTECLNAAAAAGHESLTARIEASVSSKCIRERYLVSTARGGSLMAVQYVYGVVVYKVYGFRGEGPSDAGGGRLSTRTQEEAVAAAAASRTPDWAAKVEWLLRRGFPRTRLAAAEVAAVCSSGGGDGGAAGRLAWLRGRGFPLGADAVVTAARRGALPALRYVLAEGAPLESLGEAALRAAEGGHAAALAALREHGCDVRQAAVWVAAARVGHTATLAWLAEEGLLPPSDATEGSTRFEDQLFDAAAGSGSVELLRWLRRRWATHGSEEGGGAAVAAAADAGCEEALEWLVAQGCSMPASGEPYLRAARNGDSATLRCLRRLSCPWGPPGQLFSRAVLCCGVPALAWLLQAGCTVDWPAAIVAAARKRMSRPKVLAWLRQQRQQQRQVEQPAGGSPGPSSSALASGAAAQTASGSDGSKGRTEGRFKREETEDEGRGVADESGKGRWVLVHRRKVEWWEAQEAEEVEDDDWWDYGEYVDDFMDDIIYYNEG